MRAALETAGLLLTNGEDTHEVLSELDKAVRESGKLSPWCAFALGRGRRDKRVRRLIDVAGVVAGLAFEITLTDFF